MERLKKIFSPRLIILFITLGIFAYSLTIVDRPSQSQTQGIVTVMAVDMVDDEIELACSVINPTGDATAKSSMFLSKGKTMGEAIELIGMQIGKDLGFAQCDVVAVGPNIVQDSVVRALDFFTRTKKVGKNVLLVNFDGKTDEFIQSAIYLEEKLTLKLSQILKYNKEFMFAVDSNLENFFLGYYSDQGISIVPKLTLTEDENMGGIEVQLTNMESSSSSSSQNGGSSSQSSSSQGKTIYFVNNGTTTVMKRGIKELELSPKEIEKFNLFIQDSKYGTYTVDGISDKLYKDASVVMQLEDKNSDIRYKFKKGMPVVKLDLTLYLKVEEVIETGLNKELLRREDELMTDAVVEKLKEDINADLEFCVTFMKDNNIDLFGISGWFNKFHYKKWQKYLKQEENKDNILNNIKFEWEIHIAQYL